MIGCSTMVVHRTVDATDAGSSPATQAKYGHGIKVVPWTPNPEMSVRIRLSVPTSGDGRTESSIGPTEVPGLNAISHSGADAAGGVGAAAKAKVGL